MKYRAERKVELPGGGRITVAIEAEAPIDEEAYMILRPDVASAMAEHLVDLANALRPPDSPEVKL
jgi:hypothetical protein